MKNRRPLWTAAWLTAALLAAACDGGGGGDKKDGEATPRPTNTTSTQPAAPESGGTLLGAHSEGSTDAETKKAVEDLEKSIGRKLDIEHNFFPWDKKFPTEIERWNLENGRIPLISWNGRDVYASDIADGQHDPLIMDRAIKIRKLAKPVMIRWFWEMDGKKKAEWAQSPEDYIAAWKRIHDVFEENGATNVAWVWCPNASAFSDGEAQKFYPGPDYVDWVCADGYNWAPGRDGDRWETFGEIFRDFYAWAAQQGKPIMIGEYGVQERDKGEKAAWLRDAGETVKREFPLMRALVYFNVDADYDWRLETSADATEAFKSLGADPWFNKALELRDLAGLAG